MAYSRTFSSTYVDNLIVIIFYAASHPCINIMPRCRNGTCTWSLNTCICVWPLHTPPKRIRGSKLTDNYITNISYLRLKLGGWGWGVASTKMAVCTWFDAYCMYVSVYNKKVISHLGSFSNDGTWNRNKIWLIKFVRFVNSIWSASLISHKIGFCIHR